MKREIREKTEELRNKSLGLRGTYFKPNLCYERTKELQKEQNETYKKYLFFKNIVRKIGELESEKSKEKK